MALYFKNKQSGIILVTSLLLLLIMSLLSFNAFKSSILQIKMTTHTIEKIKLDISIDSVLSQIIKTYSNNKLFSCLTSKRNPNEFINKSYDWWISKKTCKISDQNQIVYFIIEPLEKINCVRIKEWKQNKLYNTKLYRITLFAKIKMKNMKSLIQTTVNIPIQKITNCKQETIAMHKGIRTWRKIK